LHAQRIYLPGRGRLWFAGLGNPRRVSKPAAVLLVVVLVGATLTHVVDGDALSESVSAPLHLVLAATVVWATRPGRFGAVSSAGSTAPATLGCSGSPSSARSRAGARAAAHSAYVRAGSKP
jgi:hypothetical protein